MNKKAVALIVLIIILVIAGIAIAVGVSQNNENTNNLAQNESNTGSQVNAEEVGQIANNGADTNTVSNEIANINTNTSTSEGTNTEAEEDGKILVVYFSQTGNTETVANFIHEAVGGDIVKLETEQTYTSDYNELLDVAQEERRNNARPALRTQINNMAEYDTIFLGYPIWWGDMPMPIYTFLDNYDLSGKTIAPFVTSGGSGLSGTPQDIQAEEPNAAVTEGLSIRDNNVGSSQSAVEQWLSQIGF